MLELKAIKKDYPTGAEVVHALKGIDLQFRKNEFVSILGQSGCGKTTMLNIIGGLDQYTSGDLVINGRSTKDFKDRDWDAYRNHSIGFVFQSYNLIPHQSVLQNVELALTLSGVSKFERRKRAKEALEKVGLGDQLKKRPSEMSGGQMQRVAIARAIVNNPDIILADEPTGALDTETSVQVMEILKEISKDRLVIMVTHNPDLAKEYSTRIIRMLDGKITDDSAPLTKEEIQKEQKIVEEKGKKSRKQKRREKMPSMSIFTSFGLSLKNLFTKKGRTALTSFAGSIGIIGIALIFSVSQGMTTYINTIQEETLSSYPLTLEAQRLDMTSLMLNFMGQAASYEEHENDAVYEKTFLYDMVDALNNMETKENDLKAFKIALEQAYNDLEREDKLNEAINGIQYSYDLDMLIYTENVDGTIIRSDTEQLMQELLLECLGMDVSMMLNMQESYGFSSSMMMGGPTLWTEMVPGDNGALINPVLQGQYDVIYGSWPNDYNEVVLVVDEKNEIDDLTLYALGLKSREEIDYLMDSAVNKTDIEYEGKNWTYEEICNMEFKVILNSDCYVYDPVSGLYTDMRETDAGIKYLYDNALALNVSGIIRVKEDVSATMLSGSIAYTSELTKYIIEQSKGSAAIEAQLSDTKKDIFTGLPFKENTSALTDAEKMEYFKTYISELSPEKKAEMYIKMKSLPSQEMIDGVVAQIMATTTVEDMKNTLIQGIVEQTGMGLEEITKYLEAMEEEELVELYVGMAVDQFKQGYAAQTQATMQTMPLEQLLMGLEMEMAAYTQEEFATYYDEVLEFAETSYEDNLKELGYVDLESPARINIYASTFENKDVIEAFITEYNKGVDELQEITYTDYIGLMMSSITTIINAITYVLIAFVAVSLVVSSIMIGVITLISVQERTKEIGILRAIGASKKNVSSMFNAETVIIGFTSGLLGVLVTYLLCLPINLILHAVTGLNNLSAYLPLPVAIILVVISVGLTLISGIIPSRSAAKKDPVVALRTE